MPSSSRKSHAKQPATPFRVEVRKIGADVGLVLPPSLLEAADFRTGDTLEVEWRAGEATLSMVKLPRLTLDQLIAEHPLELDRAEEAREWEQARPVGKEIV